MKEKNENTRKIFSLALCTTIQLANKVSVKYIYSAHNEIRVIFAQRINHEIGT